VNKEVGWQISATNRTAAGRAEASSGGSKGDIPPLGRIVRGGGRGLGASICDVPTESERQLEKEVMQKSGTCRWSENRLNKCVSVSMKKAKVKLREL